MKIENPFRAGWLFALAFAAFLVVAFVAPQQLAVALWKAALVVGAGWLGYWVDRALFPYGRPHKVLDNAYNCFRQTDLEGADLNVHLFNTATLRRAVIVVGTMIALALAL
jgi:hypothetical protein